MDVTQASRRRTGIHLVSLDVAFYLCDMMDIKDVYRLAKGNRSLWINLELYFYERVVKLHKQNPVEAPNLISYAVRRCWSIPSLEVALEAAKIWSPTLHGVDGYRGLALLDLDTRFRKENRSYVSALLVKNLLGFRIPYRGDRLQIPWFCEHYRCFHMTSLEPEAGECCPLGRMWFDLFMPFTRRDEEFMGKGLRWVSTGVPQAEGCDVGRTDSDSILEVAVQCQRLKWTKKLLADPKVLVRPVALWRALDRFWPDGIEAILASGRLEHAQVTLTLSKALYEVAGCRRDWGTNIQCMEYIEYLVSKGADAQYPCSHHTDWNPFYPIQDPGPQHETSLSRALNNDCYANAIKLLKVFKFDNGYLVRMLGRCVMDDAWLYVTKMILELADSEATSWGEAWAAAIDVHSRVGQKNEMMIQFLFDYHYELVRLGVKFDLTESMESSLAYWNIIFSAQGFVLRG
ncbi:hypothetical protein GGR58DRAFT_479453 [Xylaria digitata]|nr:hypothetical protein GGR58DRAFT_479453 [Xylaria digitata]